MRLRQVLGPFLLLTLFAVVATPALVPTAHAGTLVSTPVTKQDTGVALTGTTCASLSPTSSVGISLSGVTGWRAIASSPASTFTGGTAQCCFLSVKVNRWMNCSSAFNITLVSGAQDVPGPDVATMVGAGKVAYLGSGVTQGSGSTFTVTYEANQK